MILGFINFKQVTALTTLKRIVLATSNQGKVIEIAHLLHDVPVDFVAQSELAIDSIDETGLTFVENSILKARQAAKLSGFGAIADDSGLVIDALNGEPGLYSARYAGVDATNQDNINKVLQQLKDTPPDKRTARFCCVMVYLSHAEDPLPLICQGVWEGQILTESQGEKGFGYDPIFYVPTHKCSAAELAIAEKNRISHRGQAVAQLKRQLETLLN